MKENKKVKGETKHTGTQKNTIKQTANHKPRKIRESKTRAIHVFMYLIQPDSVKQTANTKCIRESKTRKKVSNLKNKGNACIYVFNPT